MNQHRLHQPQLADQQAFISEARTALAALRDAARRLVDNSPTPIRRAADLHRALEVDGPLGWQVFRLAMTPDPFAVIAYVPRAGSMGKVVKHARRRGFIADAVDDVATAYSDFEDLVRRSAGSRGDFDAMIAALGREPSGRIDTRHRAAAFRANSHVWGMRARTNYRAAIIHAGSKPEHTHIAAIHGRADLQRLRPCDILDIRRGVVADEGGAPEGALSSTTLLEDFCTLPLPTAEIAVSVEMAMDVGATYETIRLPVTGTPAKVTYFGYQVGRDCPSAAPQTRWALNVLSTLPTEVLLIDLIVPRGWTDPTTVQTSSRGNLGNVNNVQLYHDAFTLPAQERAEHLGRDLRLLNTPDVPRCPEMIETLLDRLGWLDAAYDIYRCRVRYPILHSVVALAANVPE